jgi:excisionase family DNA binding protein
MRDLGGRVVDDDDLLTKQEVAEMLNVSWRTIDRWTAAGKGSPSIVLPASGRRRWRRGDVREWLGKRDT